MREQIAFLVLLAAIVSTIGCKPKISPAVDADEYTYAGEVDQRPPRVRPAAKEPVAQPPIIPNPPQ